MTNRHSWLPEDAPNTLAFNPAKSGKGMDAIPCWLNVQFSIFFDGTRNHRIEDTPLGTHSNVARLFNACQEKKQLGQFRLYVQGVGTPFPEIGEKEPHATGARSGTNGDRRLRFALLYMVNEMARLLTNKLIVQETIADISAAVEDEAQIKIWLIKLKQMLENPMPGAPVIPMITLDLFGFSRGAAAARSFLNHLLEWHGDYQPKLCGIPLRVRFMGLFDTVASVEMADSVPMPVDGHLSWAKPDHMIIPLFVEQCVHMVAGHEARNSFPLTTIDAKREDRHTRLEIVYPGMHADVGGGYGPVAQGKGTQLSEQRIRQEQQDLLSQIPLNDMYERACAAAVPLISRDALTDAQLGESFAISSEVQRSFDAHQSTLQQHRGGAPLTRLMHSHYLAYLGWRREILSRPTFIAHAFMTHCKKTQIQDHINLDQSNAELGVYVAPFSQPLERAKVRLGAAVLLQDYLTREYDCMQMYDRYWKSAPIPSTAVRNLMEQYVHDSRAGFVLTDPQCERDYKSMSDLLERKDKQYKESRVRYSEKVLPAYQARMAADPKSDEERPTPPVDPLNAADREALAIYRRGVKPIFTDAKPASSMDGKLDALDTIALSSRREVRWSYLRRRQIFRAVFKAKDNPRGEVISRGYTIRLNHEDGLS